MVDLAAGQQRVDNGALPWRHEFTSTDGSMLVDVTATREGGDSEGISPYRRGRPGGGPRRRQLHRRDRPGKRSSTSGQH
jgi:hypothetical protein